MPKANRICFTCNNGYYFCPSCPSDRKDPQIYTMWDSELCRDVFNTLVKESTKKITTQECKETLIKLGADKMEINKPSVKEHINRVMSYVSESEEIATEIIAEPTVEPMVETVEEIAEDTNVAEPTEIVESTTVVENVETEEVVRYKKNNYRKRK